MNGDNYQSLVEPLIERELEILRLISKGLSNQEVARELVLSSGTIKWYNRQIYRKLGFYCCTKAVAKARKSGLFDKIYETHPSPGKIPEHNLYESIY